MHYFIIFALVGKLRQWAILFWRDVKLMSMNKFDEYLLDDDGNIIHYSDGTPVRLEDFDQEPSAKSYAEVNNMSYKDLVQKMLDAGVPVTDEMLRKAGLIVDQSK